MKQKNSLPQVILCMSLIVFAACKSTRISKQPASRQNQTATAGRCDQVIKYYSQKIMGKEGAEINANSEIVIDPSTKLITFTSAPPNQEKVHFKVVIEDFECNLNSDFTAGQSIYKGYINQDNGTTTSTIIKVEAKDGYLTISNSDPAQEAELIILVSKWEVVRS